MRNRLLAAALAATAWLAGCAVAPYDSYPVYGDPVYAEPPPPRVEYPGYAPVVGYLWIGGYWTWTGRRHEWMPGRWEAPRSGYRWVEPRWQRDGQQWRQMRGGWQPEGRPPGMRPARPGAAQRTHRRPPRAGSRRPPATWRAAAGSGLPSRYRQPPAARHRRTWAIGRHRRRGGRPPRSRPRRKRRCRRRASAIRVRPRRRRSRRCVGLLRPSRPPSARRVRPGRRRKRNRKRHASPRAVSVAAASAATTGIPERRAKAATARACSPQATGHSSPEHVPVAVRS